MKKMITTIKLNYIFLFKTYSSLFIYLFICFYLLLVFVLFIYRLILENSFKKLIFNIIYEMRNRYLYMQTYANKTVKKKKLEPFARKLFIIKSFKSMCPLLFLI
jgi:hypothetical protein